MTVVLIFVGTMIQSSKNTSPYLVEIFFLYSKFSPGLFSCCWLSRQASVLRRLGLFVVSVVNSCKSVKNFFSVSNTAFLKSQSMGSSASTFGAWPILMHWTLLTPTYSAQLTAGTSRIDGSWSVSEPIFPLPLGCILRIVVVREVRVHFAT